MSIGISLSPSIAKRVMDYCDSNDIDYQIWNVSDFLNNNDKDIEIEFVTEKDYQRAQEYMEKLKCQINKT
jgi:spore coat polysaccharide biosynthesis protein SpsF (cytidylyltransferase family)